MKILLSVDITDPSAHAINETIDGPWPPGSTLVIAALAANGAKTPEAKAFLEKIADLLKSKSPSFIDINSVVLPAESESELLALIAKNQTDLIVLGCSDPERTGAAKILSGLAQPAILADSCSLRIARRRNNESRTYRVMLVCDGTVSANIALEQVLGRPWPKGAEFLCTAVVPSPAELLSNSPDYLPDSSSPRKLIEKANSMLERACKKLARGLPDATVRMRVISGDPRSAIIAAAEEEQTNLIILGNPGTKGLQRAISGTVAHGVALESKCSVEIVKQSNCESYVACATDVKQYESMKVLVALDETPYSQFAADVVNARQWPAGSSFKLISVIEEKDSSKAAAAAEKLIETTAERLRVRFPQASVSHEMLHGSAKETILTCAAEWGADLIALGTQGRTGLQRILLGSVSQAMLLYATSSVLVARFPRAGDRANELKNAPKRILIPLDASQHSRRALDWVLAMQWSKDCRFTILTVLAPMVEAYSDGLSMLQGEVLSLERVTARQVGQQLLKDSQQKIESKFGTGTVEVVLMEGDAGDLIVRLANDWCADLIVMGSRGHGALKQLWLGSVAQEVVLQSPCPVEVVKKQRRESRE